MRQAFRSGIGTYFFAAMLLALASKSAAEAQNVSPDTPVVVSPFDQAKVAAGTVRLTVRVFDPEGATMRVKFYGRTMTTALPPPFRIVALPDTQHYSQSYPATFRAQTRWIADHHDDMNIAYVAHEGDIVNNADVANQWKNANAALSILDSIPQVALGLAVGNHDQYPNGDPAGTEEFNARFPFTRYQDRPWYGGHQGDNNDNHYVLFSVGNLDFIAIHLEYAAGSAARSWAANLLSNYPTRRGIVVSHSILNVGDPANWTPVGDDIYNALKGCPNLFLMLCGHIHGEARRTDVAAGTVHTILADYQKRSNGGDGWMRIVEFVPVENVIKVKTYSPTLNRYEADADSQFTLAYDMGGQSFEPIGEVVTVPGQAEASITWSDRNTGSVCDWYATVSDGETLVTGQTWTFTTGTPVYDVNNDGGVDQADSVLFEKCLTGPGIAYSPSALPPRCTLLLGADGRLPVDGDKDGDVDMGDFGLLQRCYGPAGGAIDPACVE